jgi:hypothetical protein
MKRSGSSFKMKQSTKRAMMNIMDAHERGEFKRMMINAQITEATAAQRSKFKKTDAQDGDSAES